MRSIAAALLLLASVLVHWPVGVAEFAFDDRDFVQVNASLRSLPAALGAMLSPFPPDQPERALYRPLTNLSYAVDYAISGDDARGYHRTNVLLYLVVVALVYQLALAYFRRPGMALAAALLFSVHPVHTGAVDAVAGRSELLALGFGVGAILLFLRAVTTEARAAGWLTAALASYALSCLSKETGAVLPGVLLFHVLLFHPPVDAVQRARRDRALRFLVPFLLVLAGYALLRWAALGRFSPEELLLTGQPLSVRALTIGAVFAEYARLLVLPRTLQLDFYYHDVVGIPTEPSLTIVAGWLCLLVTLAGFAALVLTRLRPAGEAGEGGGGAEQAAASGVKAGRGPGERAGGVDAYAHPPPALAIVSLAILLAYIFPVSHVLDIGALLAERFLLAPSLGFVLLVVLAADLAGRKLIADPRRRTLVAALVLGLIATLGAWRSATRAAEWRDSVRIWQVTASAIPWDTRVQMNLGAAHLERGELEAAEVAFRAVLSRDEANVGALGNLGGLALQRGDFDAAREAYRRLLELEPQSYIAWNNLGLAEASLLRHSAAIDHYRRALELNANYVPARNNLQESQRSIARAERFLAERRASAAGSEDPELLRTVSAACTVVDDLDCALRFEALAAQAERR